MRTAFHLQEASCFHCGGVEHEDTSAAGGHAFWSNAQARAAFAAEYGEWFK